MTRKPPLSIARILLISATSGLVILLWSTGVIPYYLRERAIRTRLTKMSEPEALALIRASEALIAQESNGRETFVIPVDDRSRPSLPAEILKLEPRSILGGANSLSFLYDGLGDSVTAVNIRRVGGLWTIDAHFGAYHHPSLIFYPKTPKGPLPK